MRVVVLADFCYSRLNRRRKAPSQYLLKILLDYPLKQAWKETKMGSLGPLLKENRLKDLNKQVDITKHRKFHLLIR